MRTTLEVLLNGSRKSLNTFPLPLRDVLLNDALKGIMLLIVVVFKFVILSLQRRKEFPVEGVSKLDLHKNTHSLSLLNLATV